MSVIPRVSIGLPVYNGEQYVAASIEALLGQTYEDFELIISDNASTDSTPDICLEYAKSDKRVRVIRQRENLGLVPNHHSCWTKREANSSSGPLLTTSTAVNSSGAASKHSIGTQTWSWRTPMRAWWTAKAT